ncbi:hypothetical protein F5X97DRAFT_116412 [Nemania serpens]|nr:hypothetical protein F5X97DRAFT_116412 [Nemania serpens]
MTERLSLRRQPNFWDYQSYSFLYTSRDKQLALFGVLSAALMTVMPGRMTLPVGEMPFRGTYACTSGRRPGRARAIRNVRDFSGTQVCPLTLRSSIAGARSQATCMMMTPSQWSFLVPSSSSFLVITPYPVIYSKRERERKKGKGRRTGVKRPFNDKNVRRCPGSRYIYPRYATSTDVRSLGVSDWLMSHAPVACHLIHI